MIYGRIATAFGWTWEYIDEFVTIPQLLEMAEYWTQVPPLAEAFAAFIGALSGTQRSVSAPASEVREGQQLVGDLMAQGFPVPAEVLNHG